MIKSSLINRTLKPTQVCTLYKSCVKTLVKKRSSLLVKIVGTNKKFYKIDRFLQNPEISLKTNLKFFGRKSIVSRPEVPISEFLWNKVFTNELAQ